MPASAGDLLARCTFPAAGSELVCAVSGGPDSLALLVLACSAGLSDEVPMLVRPAPEPLNDVATTVPFTSSG